MKKHRLQPTDKEESIAKKIRMTTSELHIDENSWIHEIFSFLCIKDYPSVLLTNSVWNSRLKRNNIFLFFHLCLNYQRGMSFPDLKFFQSSLAAKLREELKEKTIERKIRFATPEFQHIEETIVREIMKTVHFELDGLHLLSHPSQSLVEDWQNLVAIRQMLNSKEFQLGDGLLDQLERAAPYLYQATEPHSSRTLGWEIAEYLVDAVPWMERKNLVPFILPRTEIVNIPEIYLTDREFVLQLLRIDETVFTQVKSLYGNDKEVVLTGMKPNYNSLKFASDALRSDKMFVLKAIRKNPFAFKSVSKELTEDKLLLVTALQGFCDRWSKEDDSDTTGDEIEHTVTEIYQELSFGLQNDLDIVHLAMLITSETIYPLLSPELQQNREIALMCSDLKTIPSELNNDREICLKVLSKHQEQLEYVSPELLNDQSFAVSAVQKNSKLISHFPFILSDDKLMKQVVHKNLKVLNEISEEQRDHWSTIMLVAITGEQIFGIPIDEFFNQL